MRNTYIARIELDAPTYSGFDWSLPELSMNQMFP